MTNHLPLQHLNSKNKNFLFCEQNKAGADTCRFVPPNARRLVQLSCNSVFQSAENAGAFKLWLSATRITMHCWALIFSLFMLILIMSNQLTQLIMLRREVLS